MLKYIIIGMPRSRTTWLANFLTTGDSVCLHDPFGKYSLSELNKIYPEKTVGISDTSLYMAGAKFINSLPYKKVIIHRNYIDVVKSLGITPARVDLTMIDGLHIQYDRINDDIQQIWEYCLDEPFDQDRFDILKDYNVQPHFDGMTPPNQEKIRQFVSMIHLPSQGLQ